MMKRLLEEEGLQGDDEQLAELLRSAAPFEVDPFRKRRVLVRVERGPAVASRWQIRFRPTAAIVLLITGTAAAAIGHHYAAPGTGFFGLSVAHSATATSAQPAPNLGPAPAVANANASASANASALGVAEPNGVASEPTPSPTPNASSEQPAAGTATTQTTAAAQTTPKLSARPRPESAEDASNVVEAIQALRGGRDPARAQSLLDDYLKMHPRGVLSGDALALSIEAASARNDPRAADYARRYLAIYPKGKYRDLAKRALEAH